MLPLRPTTAGQSQEPCSETGMRLEILAAPRAQGEQSGGLARQEHCAAGWPRPQMQPTLAACLESVY